MNKNLFYIVVVAAIGGFLFGFDSGVISGCEKAIQSEFALSAFWHGLIVSGALIGTVIGVFTAGRPSDKWGRKPTLWLMAVLFLVSAVGCAFTPGDKTWGPHLLGWFRFIGGLAIGGVSVVVPLYIVEVSPGRLRGRLVAMNQFNIVLGILVSYISNYLVARFMPDVDPRTVWRVMLGVECLPIALFMALLATIPESPRYLVRVGRESAARGVLERIGCENVATTVSEIAASLKAAANGADVALFQRRYAAEGVTAMHQIDLLTQIGQIQRVFQRRVAAADDRHRFPLKEAAVAGGAIGHAAAHQFALAGHAQLPLFGTAGNDHAASLIGALAGIHRFDLARKIDPGNFIIGHLGTAGLGLLSHLGRQFGTGDIDKAGIVGNLISRSRLSTGEKRLDHQGFQSRATGINARRKAGRAGTDNNQIV
jgi:MFS family permease